MLPFIEVPSSASQTADPSSTARPKRSRKQPAPKVLETTLEDADSQPNDRVQTIQSDSEYDADESKPRKKAKLTPAQKRKEQLRWLAKQQAPTQGHRQRIERYPDELYDIIDQLDFAVAQSEYDLAQATVSLENEKARYKALKNVDLENARSSVRAKNIKLGELRDKLDKQKKELEASGNEVNTLKQTLRDQQTEYLDFQVKKLQKADTGQTKVDFDDEVGATFSRIFRSSKAFIRGYAITTWARLDHTARQSVLELLQDATQPVVVSNPHGLSAIRNGLIPPNIVTNALLNRYLAELLLAHPFAVATRSETQGICYDAITALKRIHTGIREPPAAARFRCSTAISLLQGDHTSNDDYDVLDTLTEKFAKSIVDSVLHLFGFLLNVSDSSQAKAENEMLRCVQECIRISFRVHAQPPFTTLRYHDELRHDKFTLKNERMAAHPAMKIKVDEDPDAPGQAPQAAGILDHAPDLIIEPLVLRSGDDKGEIWKEERLVNRALIWICNPTDVSKACTAAASTLPGPLKNSTSQKPPKPPQTSSTSSNIMHDITKAGTTYRTSQITDLSRHNTKGGSKGLQAKAKSDVVAVGATDKYTSVPIKQEPGINSHSIVQKAREQHTPSTPKMQYSSLATQLPKKQTSAQETAVNPRSTLQTADKSNPGVNKARAKQSRIVCQVGSGQGKSSDSKLQGSQRSR